MSKKFELDKNKKCIIKKWKDKIGGDIMESVIERKNNYCFTEGKSEMRNLMDFNDKIIKRNGFSKEDVLRIVNEECKRNVKSSNRY